MDHAPPPCDGKQGCSPAQSAAVTVIHEFKTVNGVKAGGGGVDGAGPVVVDGMVLVGSGYARTGGMGGNVLLAFTPEEVK